MEDYHLHQQYLKKSELLLRETKLLLLFATGQVNITCTNQDYQCPYESFKLNLDSNATPKTSTVPQVDFSSS